MMAVKKKKAITKKRRTEITQESAEERANSKVERRAGTVIRAKKQEVSTKEILNILADSIERTRDEIFPLFDWSRLNKRASAEEAALIVARDVLYGIPDNVGQGFAVREKSGNPKYCREHK